MRINVNIVAINASRNPMASNEQLHKSLALVASGDRAGRPAEIRCDRESETVLTIDVRF